MRFADSRNGTQHGRLLRAIRDRRAHQCAGRGGLHRALASRHIATTNNNIAVVVAEGSELQIRHHSGRRAAPRGAVVKFVVMWSQLGHRGGGGGGQGCLVRAGVSLVNGGQISRTIPGHHADCLGEVREERRAVRYTQCRSFGSDG